MQHKAHSRLHVRQPTRTLTSRRSDWFRTFMKISQFIGCIWLNIARCHNIMAWPSDIDVQLIPLLNALRKSPVEATLSCAGHFRVCPAVPQSVSVDDDDLPLPVTPRLRGRKRAWSECGDIFRPHSAVSDFKRNEDHSVYCTNSQQPFLMFRTQATHFVDALQRVPAEFLPAHVAHCGSDLFVFEYGQSGEEPLDATCRRDFARPRFEAFWRHWVCTWNHCFDLQLSDSVIPSAFPVSPMCFQCQQ